jgi:energy-coupling factor transport system permease protein
MREIARLLVPVLVSALERSLSLAASMESRGYGRAVQRSRRSTTLGGALTLVGLVGVVVGLYGMLDATSPAVLGLPMLALGLCCAAGALVAGARRESRSRYRRDPWGLPEWLVCVVGVVPAVVLGLGSVRLWDGVVVQQVPATLPAAPLWAVASIAVAGLAAVVTPEPPLRASLGRAEVLA